MDVDAIDAVPARYFRDALLRSPEATLIVEWGLVVFTNRACNQLLGQVGDADVLGRALPDLLAEESRLPALARLSEVLQQEGDAVGDALAVRVKRPGGEAVEVELVLSLLDASTESVAVTLRDAGEAERAAVAVCAREQMYHSFFHASADGYLLLGPDGRILDVNDAYLHRSGYTRDEILRLGVNDLDAEESPEETAASIRQVIEDGGGTLEVRHRARDGEVWPAEVHAVYVSQLNGGCLLSLTRDISDRKRTESLLKARVLLADVKACGTVADVLEAIRTTAREVTGSTFAEFCFHPQAGLGLEPHTWELEALSRAMKSGQPVVAAGSAAVPLFRAGRVAGALCVGGKKAYHTGDLLGLEALGGVAMETLERKLALDALRRSENNLRLVTDLVPACLAYLDTRSRFLWVNEHLVQWQGQAEDEILWRPMREVVGDDTWARVQPHVERVLAGEPQSFEVRLSAGAEPSTLEVSLAPDLDEDGTARGYVLLGLDVTQVRRAQEAQERLDKLQALGTLAGGIAHDFNNMLLAISGNAGLAKSELEEGRLPRECIDEIIVVGRRASDLVRRILTFSRGGAQGSKAIHLSDAVQEAVMLLRATLPRMVRLDVHLEEGVPPVDVDPTQMIQVLINLGTNAAHAIGRKTGRIGFTISKACLGEGNARQLPPGRYVRLEVTDTGCGMRPEVLKHMYDPFYTTKPLGEGTGLGLSMVHSIVTRHRGVIFAESELDRGSRFEILLPAGEGVAEAPPSTLPELRAGHGHVLFVDDEVHLVSLVKRALTRLGYEVDAFPDAREALRHYEASPERFDVVVTDLSMPAMSGFDLARRVLEVRPGQRVLVISGYVDEADEARAREVGVEKILLKQDSLDELTASLREFVSG